MSATVSSTQLRKVKLHIRRILVCLDRSAFSEGCLPYAVSLAKTFGSALTLLHVMQHKDAGPQTNDALGWEVSRQEAQLYLERIEKEVTQTLGQRVNIMLEQGQPAERIVAIAQEIGADLTVLGNRGERGATAWNIGSTVQQVLAVSRSSVFIAHPSMSSMGIAPTRILVPLDGSLRTESVLPAATRIAAAHGAELLLAHVVQEPLATALLRSPEDMAVAQNLATRLEVAANRYLLGIEQQLANELKTVRTIVVRHSNEHQCLLEISQKEKADLIVVSAHGSACDSSRSFGSVTAYLLNYSVVPLLVLQDMTESDFRLPKEPDLNASPVSPRASYAPESV
jgi:nucleotide-binding universal stress UspA family protein